MLRIFNGERELALKACMAHAMATSKLCCFGDRKIIIHADKAVDPDTVSLIPRYRCKSQYLWVSLIGGERGPGRKMEKMPPEFLRGGCSLVE